MGTADAERHTRHFFVLVDWLSASANLIVDMTHHGDFIFVKQNEVAIIKCGLKSSEHGQATGVTRSPMKGAKRPSLAERLSGKLEGTIPKPLPERKRPSLPFDVTNASENWLLAPPMVEQRLDLPKSSKSLDQNGVLRQFSSYVE